jgi:hypothetical protein
MKRRNFLKGVGAVALQTAVSPKLQAQPAPKISIIRRVRPGDAAWPSEVQWNALSRAVEGSLIKVQSPLAACRDAPDGESCRNLFKNLKNPYYIGDEVGLTQTCGWVDAWAASPACLAMSRTLPLLEGKPTELPKQ